MAEGDGSKRAKSRFKGELERGPLVRALAEELGLAEPGEPSAEELLTHLAECEPSGGWLRRLPARESFRLALAAQEGRDHGAFVVKRSCADTWRDAAHERLIARDRRSPSQREYDALVGLAATGVPVPQGLGWGADGRGRSLVLMHWVENRGHLRECLGAIAPAELGPEGPGARWARELVRFVARMHEAGWCHRDLYLQHVLVREGAAEESALVLIDVGRARRTVSGRAPRRRWCVKDLGALLHSTPANVPWRARLRFLAEYLDLRGFPRTGAGRGRRRSFARAVERRRSSIARHVPRHDAPYASSSRGTPQPQSRGSA